MVSNSPSYLHAVEDEVPPDVTCTIIRLWRACSPSGLIAERETDQAAEAYLTTRERSESPTVLFDTEYYQSQLPPFIRDSVDPLEHYLREGWTRGLSPHIAFDSDYLAESMGIDQWAEPPLLAYFEYGQELSPHPLFDVEVYGKYVAVDKHRHARLFESFVDSWHEAQAPFSKIFSVFFYGKFELVIRSGDHNPLLHYLSMAADSRRDPNPMVHNLWYGLRYPNKSKNKIDPLVRFVRHGTQAGHLPNPFAAHELRLHSEQSLASPDALMEYVDVSRLDAEWFGGGADYGAVRMREAGPERSG